MNPTPDVKCLVVWPLLFVGLLGSRVEFTPLAPVTFGSRWWAVTPVSLQLCKARLWRNWAVADRATKGGKRWSLRRRGETGGTPNTPFGSQCLYIYVYIIWKYCVSYCHILYHTSHRTLQLIHILNCLWCKSVSYIYIILCCTYHVYIVCVCIYTPYHVYTYITIRYWASFS